MYNSCLVIRIFFLILVMPTALVRAMENNALTDLLGSPVTQQVLRFFNAVHERNITLVRDCLAAGIDRALQGDGLKYAVQEGYADIVEEILIGSAQETVPDYRENRYADSWQTQERSGAKMDLIAYSHDKATGNDLRNGMSKRFLDVVDKRKFKRHDETFRSYWGSHDIEAALSYAATQGDIHIAAMLLLILEKTRPLLDDAALLAVQHDQLALFWILFDTGLSSDIEQAVLTSAVAQGKFDTFKDLLTRITTRNATRKSFIDLSGESERRALLLMVLGIAAQCGHEHIVRYCLDEGIQDVCNEGLWVAVENSHASVVRTLLEEGALPMQGWHAKAERKKFRAVVQGGLLEVVSLLLNWRFIRTLGRKDLVCAVRSGSLSLVRALCRNDLAMRARVSALRVAATHGYWNIVEFLLTQGMPNILKNAYYNETKSFVNLFVKDGAYFLHGQRVPLIVLELAVCRGNEAFIDLFLHKGMHRAYYGVLLRHAAGLGNRVMVEKLLKYKPEQPSIEHSMDMISGNGMVHTHAGTITRNNGDVAPSLDLYELADVSSGRDSGFAIEEDDYYQLFTERHHDRSLYSSDAEESDASSSDSENDGGHDEYGDTFEHALENTIYFHRLAMLDMLLSYADSYAKANAFNYACEVENVEAVQVFLQRGDMSQDERDSACIIAATEGHASVVSLLLEAGVTPAVCHAMLRNVGSSGQPSVVEVLLAAPLSAYTQDELQSRERLIASLEDRDEEGEPFYPVAHWVLSQPILKEDVLAQYEYTVENINTVPTARELTMQEEFCSYVKDPLSFISGDAILRRTRTGQTCLMWAVLLNHRDIVQRLLGAKLPAYFINAADHRGFTALDYAAGLGRPYYVIDLAERGYAGKPFHRLLDALLTAAVQSAENGHYRIATTIMVNVINMQRGDKTFSADFLL